MLQRSPSILQHESTSTGVEERERGGGISNQRCTHRRYIVGNSSSVQNYAHSLHLLRSRLRRSPAAFARCPCYHEMQPREELSIRAAAVRQQRLGRGQNNFGARHMSAAYSCAELARQSMTADGSRCRWRFTHHVLGGNLCIHIRPIRQQHLHHSLVSALYSHV